MQNNFRWKLKPVLNAKQLWAQVPLRVSADNADDTNIDNNDWPPTMVAAEGKKRVWLSFTNPSSPRQSKATECYCAYATRGSHIKASSPHHPAIQFWRLSWLKTNSQNPILWKKNKLKKLSVLNFQSSRDAKFPIYSRRQLVRKFYHQAHLYRRKLLGLWSFQRLH